VVEVVILVGVFLIGIVSAFIGTLVGAGGLISIPFLIFVGLPPHIAIATNRFGALGRNFTTTIKFWHAKKILWKYIPILSVLALGGAYIGANILLAVSEESISRVVGIIMIAILPFVFLNKDMGVIRKKVSKLKEIIGYLFYFLIMIFGGFFGGGAGTLVFYTMMHFLGLTIVESNATDSLPGGLMLSIIVTIIFAINGLINYGVGIVLLLGMALGGYLGAHTAIKKGNKWVKMVFVVFVLLSAVKLLFF
jgi:uncharacterized protein